MMGFFPAALFLFLFKGDGVTSGRLAALCRLAAKRVQTLDHQEDGPGHDQEIQDGLDELAVVQRDRCNVALGGLSDVLTTPFLLPGCAAGW